MCLFSNTIRYARCFLSQPWEQQYWYDYNIICWSFITDRSLTILCSICWMLCRLAHCDTGLSRLGKNINGIRGSGDDKWNGYNLHSIHSICLIMLREWLSLFYNLWLCVCRKLILHQRFSLKDIECCFSWNTKLLASYLDCYFIRHKASLQLLIKIISHPRHSRSLFYKLLRMETYDTWMLIALNSALCVKTDH